MENIGISRACLEREGDDIARPASGKKNWTIGPASGRPNPGMRRPTAVRPGESSGFRQGVKVPGTLTEKVPGTFSRQRPMILRYWARRVSMSPGCVFASDFTEKSWIVKLASMVPVMHASFMSAIAGLRSSFAR